MAKQYRKMTIKNRHGVPIEVVDATAPAKIQITKQDIERSKKKDANACVAAQAALRCFRDVQEAKVHMKCTYLLAGEGKAARWIRYQTPQKLRIEAISFDRGGEVEPGEYVIKPNPVSEKLGAFRRDKPTTKKVPARGKRYKSVHVPNIRARLNSRGG